MLQVAFIRANKATVLKGLAKRNFADAEKLINTVIITDENRKNIQTELDNTLAQANKIAKEIGGLFKIGKATEANTLKEKSAELKTISISLKEKLAKTIKEYSLFANPFQSINYLSSSIDLK